MQLIRPDIGALHGAVCLRNRLLDLALLMQHALGGGIGAQRIFSLIETFHAGPGFPMHNQRLHGGFCLIFALSHHADKIAHHHNCDDTANVGDGAFIHAL